jgi:hypothetical protein
VSVVLIKKNLYQKKKKKTLKQSFSGAR